jgi:predicted glycosyl hydrolase (DUF1957 family)
VASNLGKKPLYQVKKLCQEEENKHCIGGKSTQEQTSWTGHEYINKFMNKHVHNAVNVMSGCTEKMITVV